MNKTELISAMAERSGLSKKDTEKALNAALETITAALATGDRVQLVGFGTFETKDREARTAATPLPESRWRFLPPGCLYLKPARR